jgi:hypothetical protein
MELVHAHDHADEAEQAYGYIRIPITKATTKEDPSFVEVCIEDLPPDVYIEVLTQGLKTLLNRGMSKITGTKTDSKRKEAMEVASENLEKVYSGKVRMSKGVRSSKAGTGAINTEAMRLARLLVKQALKDANKKVSHYAAKDITELAKEYLNSSSGDALIEQAKATVAARDKEAKGAANIINLDSIKEDPGLVAKAGTKRGRKPKASVADVVAGAQTKGAASHARH